MNQNIYGFVWWNERLIKNDELKKYKNIYKFIYFSMAFNKSIKMNYENKIIEQTNMKYKICIFKNLY